MATALFAPGSPDVLYLIDLSSYVLRAYHAIAPLTGPSGEPTHAVHGTVNMLDRLFRERRPTLVGVAMDSGRATFRSEIFSDYKANRPPAPDDLKIQLQRCEEIVSANGLAIFKQQGVEADDLIASAVRRAREDGLKVVVVGADKDLMQLVSDDVLLWDTMRDKVFGPAEVLERFGVGPDQLGDLLALMGDSSDNIPGVPSVGPKTACELLLAHGSIEGIYAHLDAIQRKKLRETLEANRERAFLSRRLVALKDDCPVDIGRERLAYGNKDRARLAELFTQLGFQRQLAALRREEGELDAAADVAKPVATTAPTPVRAKATSFDARSTTVITTRPVLEDFCVRAKEFGRLALEPFTTSVDAHRGPLLGLALATGRDGTVSLAGYVPLGHRYVGAPQQLDVAVIREVFGATFSAETLTVDAYDTKRTLVLLEEAGLPAPGKFAYDAKLASYLIDPEQSHALEAIATATGSNLPDYDSVAKKARRRVDWDALEVEEVAPYAGARAAAVLQAAPPQSDELENLGLSHLFADIELPLAHLLSTMEQRGVLIDTERLAALGGQATLEISELEKKAHQIAGKVFNVHAPRQLETILFDELELKPLKRTKTSRSTDAATLEALADEHPLPEVILQLRQLAKLKGTYSDALPALVDRKSRRVHGAWEQAVAATGRISSTEPNLQNIPIRSELGRKIRGAFIAPPGHRVVSADYSQIELRVLAHLSGDTRLVEAFRTGQDVHTRTAMEIFDVDEAQLTREHRTRAKAVNFGVIYGQGESGLAKSLGISRDEAGRFIAAYFRRYEGVREFMEKTLEAARAGEAVRSILGRRRLVADIKSGNRARRLAAERIAMNMPIQGSAADILKLAMLALVEPVTPGTRMVLTVHDELVFEVPEAEVEEACAAIRSKMQGVFSLDVPLVVEVGSGPDWNAAH